MLRVVDMFVADIAWLCDVLSVGCVDVAHMKDGSQNAVGLQLDRV